MLFLTQMFSPSGFMKHFSAGGGGGGLSASVPAGSYEHAVISPTNAVCDISFNSAGTCSVSAGVLPSSPAQWLTGTGTGADYWVRWTNTSGSLTTGTAGTWQQLSGTRTFGVTRTLNTAGSVVCTGTVEIATDSGGANIVATGSITLTALVDV
jgi:hypothetical protein